MGNTNYPTSFDSPDNTATDPLTSMKVFRWWVDETNGKLCLRFTRDLLEKEGSVSNTKVAFEGRLDAGGRDDNGGLHFGVDNETVSLLAKQDYTVTKAAGVPYFDLDAGSYLVDYTVTLTLGQIMSLDTAAASDLYAAALTLEDTVLAGGALTGELFGDPEVTEATIIKVWEDSEDQNGIRPASLTVTLLADGTTVQTVTLNDGNSWTATVDNLPKKADGAEITYSWSEDETVLPEGYSLTGTTTAGTVTTLTNSYTPETIAISGEKIWDDADDQDDLRPDSVTINLLADGEKWTARRSPSAETASGASRSKTCRPAQLASVSPTPSRRKPSPAIPLPSPAARPGMT